MIYDSGLSFIIIQNKWLNNQTINPIRLMMPNKCLADFGKTFREYALALGVVELCRYLISSKLDHLALDAAVLAGLQLGTPWSHGEWCRLIVPVSAALLSAVPDVTQLFHTGNTKIFFSSLLLKAVYLGLGAGISFFYHKFKRTIRKYG